MKLLAVNCFILIWTSCASSQCNGNRRNNFSYRPLLRVLRNDTVLNNTMFCTPNITESEFPLHHGKVPYLDKVIGIRKIDAEHAQICYMEKLESNMFDINTQSGGEIYTIRYRACPPGFSLYDIYCYSTTLNKGMFQPHKDWCTAKGGYLAKIDNSHENKTIIEHMIALGVDETYIGLTDRVALGVDETSIGLRDRVGKKLYGDYKWLKDDSPVTFSYWAPTKPSWAAHDCVVYGSNYQWFDALCTLVCHATCETDMLFKFYDLN